jgi:hypothetical protein
VFVICTLNLNSENKTGFLTEFVYGNNKKTVFMRILSGKLWFANYE